MGWNPDVRLSDARELAAQKEEKEKRELENKGAFFLIHFFIKNIKHVHIFDDY